jgi:hypothetical protein
MKSVVALTDSGLSVSNNVRTCAERRLLEALTHAARVRGVPSHRIIHFVRRAAGSIQVKGLRPFKTPPPLGTRRAIAALGERLTPN